MNHLNEWIFFLSVNNILKIEITFCRMERFHGFFFSCGNVDANKEPIFKAVLSFHEGSRGLMDRALDLKPEVTQSCGFESRLWQEGSTTEVRPLSKAPNPQLLPGRRNVGCPLLHLNGLNADISLLIILCIIVYVTNKAHLSLICICTVWEDVRSSAYIYLNMELGTNKEWKGLRA